MKKETTCCFTGHRPEKMDIDESVAKKWLRMAIVGAIEDGYTDFLTGMARGIDLWAAQIVLEEKEEYGSVFLHAAVPFKGFSNGWDRANMELYAKILNQSDSVTYVSDKYHRFCFSKRNKFMVDNSSLVIAAYNGTKGGTENTVNYARINGVEVRNILKED